MTYVPGSTTPADVGDPTLIADQPALGQSTLIWSNVADPPPNGSYTLTFQALPDPATYPVGATVTNTADAYVNSNARNVPQFNPDGTVVPGTDSFTGSDSATSSPTTVSAFEVTKSEPSPEGELLRGVHDNTTVYTLNVRNNPGAAHRRHRCRRLHPRGSGVPGLRRRRQHHRSAAGIRRRPQPDGGAAGRSELRDAGQRRHRHQSAGCARRRLHRGHLDGRRPGAGRHHHHHLPGRHPAAVQHRHAGRTVARPTSAATRARTWTTTPEHPPPRVPPSWA